MVLTILLTDLKHEARAIVMYTVYVRTYIEEGYDLVQLLRICTKKSIRRLSVVLRAAHHWKWDRRFPSLRTFARPNKRVDRRRRQHYVHYEYYAIDCCLRCPTTLSRKVCYSKIDNR